MKKNKNQPWMVGLVLLIYFTISFLTNILGPLLPNIIDSFHLSLWLAGFLPFSFFVAYGIISIPSGILVEMYGEKKVILLAFFFAFAGALLFAIIPGFRVTLISLFSIGLGMAALQVVINPLLRTAGGDENYAFNSVLAQLFFGLASFLSPWLYSYLVRVVHTGDSNPLIQFLDKIVPQQLEWVSLYWVFALVSLLMILVILLIRFPKVQLKEDEKIGTMDTFKQVLKNKNTLLFLFGTFAYVGSEQGISNWISKFLQLYHGVNPETTGASVIAWFWGLMTLGCVLGLGLLKLLDSRKILILFSLAAMLCLSIALFGSASAALIAFPLCGFFASVMWGIIMALGMNSVPYHHGTLAGILCTGIVGGAVVPLIIGGLSEWIGLRGGMLFLFISLGYVLSIGFWAKPLVTNATIESPLKSLFKKKIKA